MKKAVLWAIVGFAALTLLATGLNLEAGSGYQYTRVYYTDASKTEVCGETMYTCNDSSHWGCRTSYYDDIYDAPCGGGGGTQCSDGIDNDGDQLTDLQDPGCENQFDWHEAW